MGTHCLVLLAYETQAKNRTQQRTRVASSPKNLLTTCTQAARKNKRNIPEWPEKSQPPTLAMHGNRRIKTARHDTISNALALFVSLLVCPSLFHYSLPLHVWHWQYYRAEAAPCWCGPLTPWCTAKTRKADLEQRFGHDAIQQLVEGLEKH